MRNALLTALAASFLSACGGEGEKTPPAGGPGATAPAAPAKPAGWREVAEEAFTAAEIEQRGRANAAREALQARLMERLAQMIAGGGPAGALTVCRAEAAGIAQAVGKEKGVRIGRTSFKLRNASNAAPEWAAPYVEQRRAEPVYLLSDDGKMAAFQPILLKKLCLQCHGDPAKIDAPVKEALAKAYPEDKATGFAEGELRGWFWIEVPAR